MNIHNLSYIYHSIKSSSDHSKSNLIGIKDLRTIEVVKKCYNEFTNSNHYECRLTFKDGIQVLCNFSGVMIADITKTQAFRKACVKLKGLTSTECFFNQVRNAPPGQISSEPLNYDALIGDLHQKGKKE